MTKFNELAKLSGAKDIFGLRNPLRQLPKWLSGDAAGELLRFFQRVEPETGRLVHDFTDGAWDTRFLGDLYQDLSEVARKKYALLQTPEFVAAFILAHTLEPAIDKFQLEFQRQEFRIIDPACGSGHLLLDSFYWLLNKWVDKEPGTSTEELVLRSLKSIYGVDINPYAVAIAVKSNFNARKISCSCSKSALYYTERFSIKSGVSSAIQGNLLSAILVSSAIYATNLCIGCSRRVYEIDYCKLIYETRVCKKLIENFIPKVDLTHVIDTSGDYIPGHGTPTVILLGRNRRPNLSTMSTIRTVMGIRGEPSTPDDPAKGLVWSAIVNQVDFPGSQSEFVSVADLPRLSFCKHPWSIGGGGASELKEWLDRFTTTKLSQLITSIGFFQIVLICFQDAGGEGIFAQSLPMPSYGQPLGG